MKKRNTEWIQHLKKYTFCIFLLLWVPSKCNCSGFILGLDQTDTINQKNQNSSLQIIKFSPGQLILGEIPFSWEIFKNKNESIQFQFGILVPFFRNFPSILGSMLPPPSSNLISPRTMPFINYGISSKIEIREYGRKNYIAFQGMYKYSAYSNMTFTIWDSNPIYETYDQIESKKSHILGIGIIIGRQTYMGNEVRDLYCGLGLRLRILNCTIEAEEYPNPLGRLEKNIPLYSSSIYPFLNLGIRFGKTFHGKQKTSR